MWVRQPARVDNLQGVASDAVGNVYVVGSVIEGDASCRVNERAGPPFCSYDAYVAKFNPGGQLLWSKSFGTPAPSTTEVQSEAAYRVAVDAGGNAYVLASLVGPPASLPGVQAGPEGSFLKFSPTGTLIWSKAMSDAQLSRADMTVDAAGSVYLLGHPEHAAADGSATLAKFTAEGSETGTRREITLNSAYFAPAPERQVLVTGCDAQTNEAVLQPVAADLSAGTERRFAPEGRECLSGAAVDAQGRAAVVWVSGEAESRTAVLSRYAADNSLLRSTPYDWKQNLNPEPQEGVYSPSLSQITPLFGANGTLYLSYNVLTQGIPTRDRYRSEFLAKLDAGDQQVWLNRLDATGGNTSAALPLLTPGGALYQAGYAQGGLEGAGTNGPKLEFQGFLIRWTP
ncbi:hypothetical protein [Deinococcus peraridilitoris]|nr:hypothetical protein [Deinococcus peraridilitoris]